MGAAAAAGPAGGLNPVEAEAERRRRKAEKKRKKKELLEQLRKTQAEKAEVDRQLQVQAAAAPAALGGGSKKRPLGAAGAPSGAGVDGAAKRQKKQKVLKDRAKRMQNLWSQCATIVKQVKQNKQAWPFHVPVDPVALNLPDYFNIVKKPISIKEIIDKLGGPDGKNPAKTYQSPLELRDDMRQMFDNCRLYNQPGQDVRIMGDMLSDLFEKKWQNSNLEGKYMMEMDIQKLEDDEFLAGGGLATTSAAPTAVVAAAAPKPAPRPAPKPVPAPQAMSFEQKRKLSVSLGMMPADKLARVVEIINSGPSQLATGDDDEIELDIDALDNVTLWKLDDYVNACKKKKPKSTHDDKLMRAQQAKLEAERQLKQVQASLSAPRTGTSGGVPDAADTAAKPAPAAVPAPAMDQDSDSGTAEASRPPPPPSPSLAADVGAVPLAADSDSDEDEGPKSTAAPTFM